MTRYFWIVVLLALLPSEVHAKTDIASVIEFARSTSLRYEQLASPQSRIDVVQNIDKYCQALRVQYPVNSPSEASWLDQEISASGSRALRAFQSAEYGRQVASIFFQQCEFGSKLYLQENGNKVQGLFILINAFARFGADAEHYGKLNGVNADRWAFALLGSAVRTLSDAGVHEGYDAGLIGVAPTSGTN